ncbi:MAG TPA: COX15/CtaA family protein [Jatrophihabitans sp.]|nr:COX15/CtaA family protein [Jatrophihabitans sp.]
MGVTIPAPTASATPPAKLVRWLPGWLQTATALRRLALASVIANVGIVVTGGAVRLTDSGLGCPTWPSCTDSSLTPTRAYAIHGVIEFTNRQLTFVLAVIAVATWVVAMVRRRERALATLAALGIPAQAVLGGLTVLTHLNPWLVAAHFLLSMAIIAATFALWWRVRDVRTASLPATPGTPALVWATVSVTAAVLVIGTVVTGSGPHAGDRAADGTVRRTGLQVSSMAQLHADAVMVLIGLTAGLVALLFATRAAPTARRAGLLLLAAELGQGAIGYVQYFLDVPPLLVGLHMLGACAVWLAALNVAARLPSSPDDHARTVARTTVRA